MGRESDVKLMVTVEADGHVSHVELLSSGGEEFDREVEDALERARFVAAQKGGEQVAAVVRFTVRLRLDECLFGRWATRSRPWYLRPFSSRSLAPRSSSSPGLPRFRCLAHWRSAWRLTPPISSPSAVPPPGLCWRMAETGAVRGRVMAANFSTRRSAGTSSPTSSGVPRSSRDSSRGRRGASAAAVHLVSGNPEDPYEEGRVSGVGGKAAENRDEDLLGDVFGFSGVAEALHREAKDAREVRLVQEIEVFATPGQNLGHKLRVARPSLLCVRQDVLSYGRLFVSQAMSASNTGVQCISRTVMRAPHARLGGFSWRIDTESGGSI